MTQLPNAILKLKLSLQKDMKGQLCLSQKDKWAKCPMARRPSPVQCLFEHLIFLFYLRLTRELQFLNSDCFLFLICLFVCFSSSWTLRSVRRFLSLIAASGWQRMVASPLNGQIPYTANVTTSPLTSFCQTLSLAPSIHAYGSNTLRLLMSSTPGKESPLPFYPTNSPV